MLVKAVFKNAYLSSIDLAKFPLLAKIGKSMGSFFFNILMSLLRWRFFK